ncbi:hypothetical protein JW898_04520 [Candidatus Woesearchaeota archaeon]|nr:hypothetical protein [Candidatus Woesearchaeota archaeon]
MSSNYESHPDYTPLTQRVQEALVGNSSSGRRIDDFVPEAELHRYNPSLVLYVAAQLGFEIHVCRYGEVTHTHEEPMARANGVWIDMPAGIEEKFMRGGEYAQQEDPHMCSACEVVYQEMAEKIKKLREDGAPEAQLVSFGCFSDIVL